MSEAQTGPTHGDSVPGAGGAVPATTLVPSRPGPPQLHPAVEGSIDVALGAAVTVARPVVHVAAALTRALTPLATDTAVLVTRPPLVPEALTLGGLADRLGDRGRRMREAAGQDAVIATGQSLDVAIPLVLDPVLDRIDLTTLVIQRVDLARLVAAVLDRMDLTEVVLERVDLGRVINGALDQIDLNDLVRTRVDLAGIAEEVIDDVDLPEIIRDSTTGVAGAVVDGTRLRAVEGDELINRLVDRILLRRKARRTAAPEGALDEDPTIFDARPADHGARAAEPADGPHQTAPGARPDSSVQEEESRG